MPDLRTPEGRQEALQIIRREEFDRFCELQRQFIQQIEDDSLREQLEAALARMERVGK